MTSYFFLQNRRCLVRSLWRWNCQPHKHKLAAQLRCRLECATSQTEEFKVYSIASYQAWQRESQQLVFCTNNNILSIEQHGFVNRKFSFTYLLKTSVEWTSALDNGFGVDVIYLDYSKAFNSILHQRLIAKLEAYGIRGDLCTWMQNFPSN